jgi:hypothetical protein
MTCHGSHIEFGRGRYSLAVRLSDVPLIVIANDWGCVNTPTDKLSRLVPLVGLVPNDPLTPEGRADVIARDTFEEKPPV